jgi:hypothetical protein
MPDEEDEDSRVDVAMMWATWDAFLSAGGVTADDLARFLKGERINDQPVKRRRHLRLVRSNNPSPPGKSDKSDKSDKKKSDKSEKRRVPHRIAPRPSRRRPSNPPDAA